MIESTRHPFQSSLSASKKDDMFSTLDQDYIISNGITTQSEGETAAQMVPNPTTSIPTKSLKERREEMKKQFEESLHEEDVKNLPDIQVLQVFEATERVPAISSGIKLINKDMTDLTSPFHIGNVLTVHLSQKNETISNTIAPSLLPETQSSNNSGNKMEERSISDEMFIKRPSHWNKNDKRFQGVKTRRFIGSREVPHSIFDDGMYNHFTSFHTE